MTEDEIKALKAALAKDADRYRRLDRGRDEAAKDAIQKALTLLREGVGPAEVARLSPFTDAYIRKYAREAGIPPAREPRGVTKPKEN